MANALGVLAASLWYDWFPLSISVGLYSVFKERERSIRSAPPHADTQHFTPNEMRLIPRAYLCGGSFRGTTRLAKSTGLINKKGNAVP